MSKRLQVLVDESELRDIQRVARRQRMTVAEWVRQAMQAARAGEGTADPVAKLAAISTAAAHAFPTGQIGEILAHIEGGYSEGGYVPKDAP